MEPRSAAESAWPWVAEGECCSSVGEHGALAVRLNHHHDAGAATTTLEEWLHTSVQESRLEGVSGRVFTNRANEACGAPSCYRCHGNVGGATTAPSRDLGGGIRPSSPWLVQPHGDLVDEVAHTDDQWA